MEQPKVVPKKAAVPAPKTAAAVPVRQTPVGEKAAKPKVSSAAVTKRHVRNKSIGVDGSVEFVQVNHGGSFSSKFG